MEVPQNQSTGGVLRQVLLKISQNLLFNEVTGLSSLETSQLVCKKNRLTDFYMSWKAFNFIKK